MLHAYEVRTVYIQMDVLRPNSHPWWLEKPVALRTAYVGSDPVTASLWSDASLD